MRRRDKDSTNAEVAQLMEMGVNEQFVSELSDSGIRELLNGLLYLRAEYARGRGDT